MAEGTIILHEQEFRGLGINEQNLKLISGTKMIQFKDSITKKGVKKLYDAAKDFGKKNKVDIVVLNQCAFNLEGGNSHAKFVGYKVNVRIINS